MQPASLPDPTRQRLEQMLEPSYPLRKEDVVWILDYIKKKVAEEAPRLTELSQPRLVKTFCCFAEVAMMLIHHRPPHEHEADRLKGWIREALDGLKSEPPR